MAAIQHPDEAIWSVHLPTYSITRVCSPHDCVCVCVCVVDDKSKTQEQMAPEIIRAFTELFFIVENLAEVRPLY